MNIIETKNLINRERIKDRGLKSYLLSKDAKANVRKLSKKLLCFDYNIVESAIDVLYKIQKGELVVCEPKPEPQQPDGQ